MKSKRLEELLARQNLSASKTPDLDSWKNILVELDHVLDETETQKSALKAQLNNLQTYAITSAKNTVLGQLVGGIAHEINNPLAVIQLRSDQLLELTESDDIKKDFFIKSLKSIDLTVRKISEILTELRSFAKGLPSDGLAKQSIKQTIEHTLALCNHRFNLQGIRINFDCNEDFTYEARPAEISQILIHLLNNSYDAVIDAKEKWIRIEARKLDNDLVLSVTDSGLGVAADIQDKLLEPFFTTKSTLQRSGLGLTIVKNILDSYHSKIFLDRTSANTQFQIVMPVARIKTG